MTECEDLLEEWCRASYLAGIVDEERDSGGKLYLREGFWGEANAAVIAAKIARTNTPLALWV